MGASVLGPGGGEGGEQAALLTELRRHPLFALLDLQHNVGLGMTQLQAGKRVEWVIKAIADYAAGNSVPGLTPQTIQRGLAGYIRNSRAPKVIDSPARRQEPGIDYPELKRERKAEQAQRLSPAEMARRGELIAGIGRKMT